MSFTLWKFSLQWNWGSELRFFFCLSFLCGHCGPILRLFKRQALQLLSHPMSSPYSLSVACASFYLYFSFTHSAILFFFYLILNRSPFLRSSFMLAFMSPCPLKTPFGWLFPHFLPSSLSLSCAFSLKCTFSEIALWLGFCSVILMGNIVFSNKYGCQIHSTCVKVFAGVFSEGATVTVLTHLVP